MLSCPTMAVCTLRRLRPGAVQVKSLHASAVLTWHWRWGGFLESCQSSVHMGRLKKLGSDASNVNRIDTLNCRKQKQASKKSCFSLDFIISRLPLEDTFSDKGSSYLSSSFLGMSSQTKKCLLVYSRDNQV